VFIVRLKLMNKIVAKILREMALILEMKDVPFKPRAFEKAASGVELLDTDVKEIYKLEGSKGLEKIPGVGRGIAEKIEEFIKTKRVKDYEKLKKEIPVKLDELDSIEGMGPKKIYVLYKKLNIKNVKDLEKAAKLGEISKLEGFGKKTEESILEHIKFYKKHIGRFLLKDALPLANEIVTRLKKVKDVKTSGFMGSVRRKQETIGDLDILVISTDPKKVMDFFVSMPEVDEIHSKGETRSSVKFYSGMNSDLRVVSPKSFGSASQYFTGDKQHNIEIRKIAISMGYKLNEYGLWKGKKRIAGENEKEIYEKLGLEWMPPEIRNNSGEIQAAKNGTLPKLIKYNDLKGDLQMHTDWSDGKKTILEMAEAAKKGGLEYIAITDHTKSLAMTGGNDEKMLLKQMAEIDKIQKKISGIKILKSAEVDILKDGSMDIEDSVLGKLDIVGGSIHSNFHMSKKDMTNRIMRAMENPHVDVICHPTGRLIQKRDAYGVDMEKLLKTAKKTNTIMEIDAFPNRLDLKDEHIRMAIGLGVKLSISTDAHHVNHLKYLEFGIAQARRGWAEKKDIINTRPWEKMLKLLK